MRSILAGILDIQGVEGLAAIKSNAQNTGFNITPQWMKDTWAALSVLQINDSGDMK